LRAGRFGALRLPLLAFGRLGRSESRQGRKGNGKPLSHTQKDIGRQRATWHTREETYEASGTANYIYGLPGESMPGGELLTKTPGCVIVAVSVYPVVRGRPVWQYSWPWVGGQADVRQSNRQRLGGSNRGGFRRCRASSHHRNGARGQSGQCRQLQVGGDGYDTNGGVPYNYQIGKFEVTAGQYAEFRLFRF